MSTNENSYRTAIPRISASEFARLWAADLQRARESYRAPEQEPAVPWSVMRDRAYSELYRLHQDNPDAALPALARQALDTAERAATTCTTEV